MKLYYSPGVCSLAPHITLREAGLAFALEKVDAATKRTETGQDFLTIHPNGYVPALEIESGVILTEGPAIMQYIADQTPAAKLAPAAGSMERYRLQEWLNFITSEIHKSFAPLFKPGTPAETKTGSRELIAKRFDHVERRLAGQHYLLDSGFSVADIYLFVTSGWSGFVDIDLKRWPALTEFRKRIGARPAVNAAQRAEGLIK